MTDRTEYFRAYYAKNREAILAKDKDRRKYESKATSDQRKMTRFRAKLRKALGVSIEEARRIADEIGGPK